MTDWHDWHKQYADPTSSLSRRLDVVRRRLDEALDSVTGAGRLLSLCAGDGRDVIPVVAKRALDDRPHVTLVELDPVLAARAREHGGDAAVELSVVVGDAGACANWQSAVPVDVLLLCGIFGNVAHDDIRRTIEAVPTVLASAGTVIWTRGAFEVDLRPQIRQWFRDNGMTEIAFDAEPRGYGVGVNRLATAGESRPLPDRLFTFVR